MNTPSAGRRLSLGLASLALVLSFPSWALAHGGIGQPGGFLAGLSHPITGLDHILAMLAVGVWAAQRGGRSRHTECAYYSDRSLWLVPLTFLVVMALGGVLGAAGIALPGVERWIAASVLALGVLIAAAVRMPLLVAASLVGLFAFFHGHAHGAEMSQAASSVASAAVFGGGFLVTTAMLHLAGIGIGAGLQRYGSAPLVRFAGAAIAACGVYLCV